MNKHKKRMIPFVHFLLISSLLLSAFSACSMEEQKQPAYEIAQGCFALQTSDGDYSVISAEDNYTLAEVGLIEAEKFFLKPTSLGWYLLYDRTGSYLAADPANASVVKSLKAAPGAEWQISVSASGDYGLLSKDGAQLTNNGGLLSVYMNKEANGRGSDNFALIAQPGDSCNDFPEASVNATVDERFYQTGPSTIRGFVDTHTHFGMVKAMGTVTMAGELFHPYGIEHALGNCADLHGPNGSFDLLESGFSGTSSHDTAGYPDFPYWPNNGTVTHTQAYYKWIERAYLSGLRVVTTLVSGNQSMCELMSMLHPLQAEGNCKADDVVRMQTNYIKELESYIDAQEGGPGQGWFRIVTSPEEARAVIAQNKLAVLLGTEYNSIFDCRVGAEFCTDDYIDRKVDELHEMGIRVVFPVHKHDNSFGGHKAQSGDAGAWFNLTNKLNTGEVDHVTDLFNPLKLLFKDIGGNYWEYNECPAGVQGTTNMADLEQFFNEDFVLSRDMLSGIRVVGPAVAELFDYVFFDKLAPYPTYEEFDGTFHGCNIRGLQPAGRRLLTRLMDKGMLIDIDHMSHYTFLDAISMLEERQYSGVISSHGWTERAPEFRRRILALGGMITSMGGNPTNQAANIAAQAQEMSEFPYRIGIGVATDVQGITGQPKGGTVSYPFQSYDGTVTFSEPITGNKFFDYNTDGMSHYGLFPEYVESLRQASQNQSADVMDIFMSSAEAYLEMWERAEQANRPATVRISLRSAHNRYFVSEGNGGSAVNANRRSIGAWEKFVMETAGPAQCIAHGSEVSIRTDRYYYWSARPGGALDGNRTGPGSWERFTLVNHSDSNGCLADGDMISLRGAHGKYVVAEWYGAANANRSNVGSWEKMRVVLH